jgi:hypothetical protein
MSGAGELDVVIFEVLIHFFCGVTASASCLEWWETLRMHGLTLVSLRQTRRIANSHLLTQIELTLMRVRLFISSREWDHARGSARIAMSYVRLMIHVPNVTTFMIVPQPDPLICETDDNVAGSLLLAEAGYHCAVDRGRMLDMWDPPSSTDSDSGSDDDADDIFDEESEADEDIRFLDGSPLLDTVRF